MGTLYLVATPIGNLEDISQRALRTLSEVRLIAAEDTRQTRKLLTRYGIHARLISYHAFSPPGKLRRILEELSLGDVALVSDAGTPGLNDPGYELVRATLEQGHTVRAIPGASAPIAALICSGLPTDRFLYLGYLPHRKSERRRLLAEVSHLPYTLIFLETPHRLRAALEDIETILGDRPMAVARELTKIHEEIFHGSVSAAREHFSEKEPLGEFTLVIGGYQEQPEPWSEDKLRQAIREGLMQGESAAHLAARLAGEAQWPRRRIYLMINAMRKG